VKAGVAGAALTLHFSDTIKCTYEHIFSIKCRLAAEKTYLYAGVVACWWNF
jgi:hypothetical protein